MTLIVYGVKNGELFRKVKRDYFAEELEPLFVSWAYAFSVASTLIATSSGSLLFMEYKNIVYQALYSLPSDQSTLA